MSNVEQGLYGTPFAAQDFPQPAHKFNRENFDMKQVFRGLENGVIQPAVPIQVDPNGLKADEPGAKLDADKPLYGLLLQFSRALEAVGVVADKGARKYSKGGWQHVPNGVQRYWHAFNRHMLALGREDRDPEGFFHLHQMAWNLLAVIELMERGRSNSTKIYPMMATELTK